jgi:hypothetical protein
MYLGTNPEERTIMHPARPLADLSLLISLLAAFALPASVADALSEDFDGGGTVPYTLTSSGNDVPSVITGGPTGNFVRVSNLSNSNNNSIAFDEDPGQTGPAPTGLRLSFDFRMTDDASNAAAGGCCGSAADGLGIGLFDTGTYGSTGGNNPPTGFAVWERPAFVSAFAIGLDVFQNLDVVNLNWGGVQVAEADVSALLDLNDNLFHRAIVDILPNGSNALVNMNIIEDVNGGATKRSIFAGEVVSGMNLNNLFNYRVIAGGRTGGAYTDGDFDNIRLVPEPSTYALTLGGLIAIIALGRRPSRTHDAGARAR